MELKTLCKYHKISDSSFPFFLDRMEYQFIFGVDKETDIASSSSKKSVFSIISRHLDRR